MSEETKKEVIDESWLIRVLKEEIQKQIIKESLRDYTIPTIEERIDKMENMMEMDLPDILQKGILRNIIDLMSKKINRDYCE